MATAESLTNEQSALLSDLASRGISASIRRRNGESPFICSLRRSAAENISRSGDTIETAIERATETASLAWFELFAVSSANEETPAEALV